MKLTKTLMAAAVAGPMALAAMPSHAIDVGLELALLIDVSGSVDDTEYGLQMNGYKTAFNSAAVQAAIAATATGSIAVTVIQWSSAGEQAQSIGWTQVTSANAGTFGDSIGALARSFSGLTAPGSAINYIMNTAAQTFATNSFDSLRQVIDVSGDGEQNDGANTATARNNALLAGIDAINGLAIGGAGLVAWYEANIKGGAGAFVEQATDFADFGAAIERKIIREVTGVPEPTTMVAFGAALLGLAGLRRRKA